MNKIKKFDSYKTVHSAADFLVDSHGKWVLPDYDEKELYEVVERAFELISWPQDLVNERSLTSIQWDNLLSEAFSRESEMKEAITAPFERSASLEAFPDYKNLKAIHQHRDWDKVIYPGIVDAYTDRLMLRFSGAPEGYQDLKHCFSLIGAAALYLVDRAVGAIARGDTTKAPQTSILWAKLLLVRSREIGELAPESAAALAALGAAARHKKNNELAVFARKLYLARRMQPGFSTKAATVKSILREVRDEGTRRGLTFSQDNFERTVNGWMPKRQKRVP